MRPVGVSGMPGNFVTPSSARKLNRLDYAVCFPNRFPRGMFGPGHKKITFGLTLMFLKWDPSFQSPDCTGLPFFAPAFATRRQRDEEQPNEAESRRHKPLSPAVVLYMGIPKDLWLT